MTFPSSVLTGISRLLPREVSHALETIIHDYTIHTLVPIDRSWHDPFPKATQVLSFLAVLLTAFPY